MVAHWVRVAGATVSSSGAGSRNLRNIDGSSSNSDNAALALLRDALGGNDNRTISQNLTVEMDERWMDDVSILVQRL
jgi:pyruvate dehydrogenase phosphatase